MSRVVQTFRRCCLRKRILDDEGYEHLLSREQVKVKSSRRGSEHRKSGTVIGGDAQNLSDRVVQSLDGYDPEDYDPADGRAAA